MDPFPMRRGVLTFFSLLSLLLCVAVCGLWVRSYWVTDHFSREFAVGELTHIRTYSSGEKEYRVDGVFGKKRQLLASELGRFVFATTREFETIPVGSTVGFQPEPTGKIQYEQFRGRRAGPSGFLGFYGYRSPYRINANSWELREGMIIPHWAVAAFFGVPAALMLIRIVRDVRRTRRIASGRCASCGYDLRATPARCPECGKAAA
jgi:hypothetical protein